MKIQIVNKEIILCSTHEITIRKFLLPILEEYNRNNLKLLIICRDVENLYNFICLKKNINLDNIQFKNINFPNKILEIINPYNILKILFNLRKILHQKDKKYYIHCNTPIASHLIRFSNIGLNNYVLYHVHGFRFHKKGNFLRNIFNYNIEKFLSFFTSSYITINQEDTEIVKNNFKKKFLKINGVGVNFSKLSKIKKNAPQNKKYIIGFIGAYKKEKGYLELFKIAKLCKNLNIIFKCYGYGNKTKFLKKLKKNNLRNVELNIFTEKIYEEMSKFDLFLCCSKREGLNVSILEAMAMNIPVISSRIRGTEDIIKNNKFGHLYENNKINEVCRLINNYFDNTELFNFKASLALNEVKNNYNSNKIAKYVKDNLIKIINET